MSLWEAYSDTIYDENKLHVKWWCCGASAIIAALITIIIIIINNSASIKMKIVDQWVCKQAIMSNVQYEYLTARYITSFD